MASMHKTFADLWAEVGLMKFGTASPTSTNLTTAKKRVNEGYRDFLEAADWSFLKPKTTITVWPTVMTGTITVSGTGNTTLTSSTACFYASMVGRTITAATSGTSYTISGYTSSTVVTVSASAAADTGRVFTVTADGLYGLPSDFGGMIEGFSFASGSGIAPLAETTPEHIRVMQSELSQTGDPTHWAIEPRAYTTTDGQRWDLLVWPTPDTARVLSYRYQVEPLDMATDGEYPRGGLAHAATIHAAVMAATERDMSVLDGRWAKEYEKCLARSIRSDGETKPRNLGRMVSGYETPPAPLTQTIDTWTYTT